MFLNVKFNALCNDRRSIKVIRGQLLMTSELYEVRAQMNASELQKSAVNVSIHTIGLSYVIGNILKSI